MTALHGGDEYESRFIGAGKVGFSLGRYLAEGGVTVTGITAETADLPGKRQNSQERIIMKIWALLQLTAIPFSSQCRTERSPRVGSAS